jgi:hypothetical protein
VAHSSSTEYRSIHSLWLMAGAALAATAVLIAWPARLPPPAGAEAVASLGGSHAQIFEENLGQTDTRARFLSRGRHYTQFLTDDAIVWRLAGAGEAHAVYMTFPGSARAQVRGLQPLSSRSSYLRGNDPAKWVRDARQYSAVVLAGLYPGIDLKVHGERGQPEYDFVVAPQADAHSIRVRFQGADQVTVGADGALNVSTPGGKLIHHTPVAWQRDTRGQTTWVDARFVPVAPGELRFELGAYDRARELVIDPVYEYSTYLGGTGSEGLAGFTAQDPWQAITVNAAGEAYAAGVTSSTDFPTTPGTVQPALREDLDFYVVKLNAAGDALLYSTYLGGTGDEIAAGGIHVNAMGEVLFAGLSQSDDFPTTPGSYRASTSSGWAAEIVALKLNATGTALVYSTYLGSSANERLFGFAVDSAQRIVVAGSTVSGATTPYPFTAGAYSNTGDQFITKIAADGGSLVWSSSFGLPFGGGIRIRALALDSSDNVFFTGRVSSLDAASFPLQNAYDTTIGGDFDGFVTKMAANGSSLIYSTFLGGSNTDEALAIAVDGAGSAYVAGSAGDFPVTPGAFLTTQNVNWAGFLAKLAPIGDSIVWATYTQRPNFSANNAIVLDAANRVYLTTNGNAPLSMRVGESPEVCLANVGSASVVRFAADGSSLEYGMRVGAPVVYSGGFDISSHLLNAIAIDANDNVFVFGTTNSADFPTYHAFQPAKGDGVGIGNDAFIAKLSDDAPYPMPTLAFSAGAYSVAEPAGTAVITVNRTGRAAGPVKIRVQTIAGGTATVGNDYTAVDTLLEWRNGDLTPKTVNVPIATDAVADGGETVNLALSDNQWCLGDVGAQGSAVLTINDAAAPPVPGTLQLSTAAYTVAEGGANATITVTRTGGSDGAVSARLATSNGTATAGSDYTATDVIVNFAAGDAANKTVNVPITQDATDEPDETVALALSVPTGGATLGATSNATLTITDDDAAPPMPGTLQLSAATYSVGEGGANAAITVTRTGGSDGAVSARLATSNGTATAGADYTAADVIVNFAAGDAANKTVNVPVTQDATDEPDETVALSLSAPTGGATLGATTAATLTIADDDPTPAPPVPPAPPPGGGGGGGGLDGVLLAVLAVMAAMRRRPRATARARRLPAPG